MADSESPLTLENLAGWLSLDPTDLLKACVQSPFQGPGPGGQKRNRVYSGVRLRHAASGLAAEASERREARRNLEDALRRLRLSMALSLPPAEGSPESGAALPLPPGRPPVAFRAQANPGHPDFPLLALAALHALDACGGRPSLAAESLGTTTSALTRFLRGEKPVWAKAQGIRKRHGLHALKSD